MNYIYTKVVLVFPGIRSHIWFATYRWRDWT